MGYNRATLNYTMNDDTGSLDWIVAAQDRDECAKMTDDEIGAWVDLLIDQEIEFETGEFEEQIGNLVFPRYGYSMAQVFEDADEYRDFKIAEITNELRAERDRVIGFIKNWIAESVDDE